MNIKMTCEEAIEEIRSCLGVNNIIEPYSDEMIAFGMAIEALQKQAISDKTSDKVNKILDELKWKLLSRLSHLEIENHNPIELHETIEDIVVDEIDKIKISTI